jgi:hypothetical protein
LNGDSFGTAGLVLYGRRDCSLCDEMEAAIRRLAGPAVQLEVVEIDDAPELLNRFGADVPVLCLDGEVLCRHFLDAERLTRALSDAG